MKLSLWAFTVLLAAGVAAQTTVPVNPTTVTIPAGTFESPLLFHPPLSRLGNDVFCSGCGGASTGGSTIGPPSQAVVNLYVAPGGSNAGTCSSAAPCLTLAYALAQIPALVAQPYQVNVADGTYAEPIDTRGYIGSQQIAIVGDNATPANVLFTGTMTNCEAPRWTGFTSQICIAGAVPWFISGVSTSSTARNGITCAACNATLSNVTVGGSLVSGINNETGTLDLQGAINVSGFGRADAGNSSFGIYNLSGRIVQSGIVTINGPGWPGSLMTYGIAQEFQSSWTLLPTCDTCSLTVSINISNVRYGIQGTSNSAFASFVSTGTITITNPTQSPGNGLDLYNEATFDLVGGTNGINLTISNFANCISSQQFSTMSHGPGNRSLTGCNAASGSQVVLF